VGSDRMTRWFLAADGRGGKGSEAREPVAAYITAASCSGAPFLCLSR